MKSHETDAFFLCTVFRYILYGAVNKPLTICITVEFTLMTQDTQFAIRTQVAMFKLEVAVARDRTLHVQLQEGHIVRMGMGTQVIP